MKREEWFRLRMTRSAFALTGAGRILGVDNGQPDSHESYQGPSRRAFNGLALVVLQSTGAPGTFTLSASSPGTYFGKH